MKPRLLVVLLVPLLACSKLADFPDKSPEDAGEVDAPDDGMEVGDLVDVDPDNPDVSDPDVTDVPTDIPADRPTDPETEDEPCVEAIPKLEDQNITSGGTGLARYPSVAWSGSEYGVAFRYYDDPDCEIFFVRIDADGSKLAGDTLVTNHCLVSDIPSLVWAGSEFGIAWADESVRTSEIFFARISGDGTKIGTDLRVTDATNLSRYPSLVWSGSEYGVTWEDQRDGNREIYFNIVSPDGTSTGTELRITNDTAGSGTPSIAWSGNRYGIAWWDGMDGNDEIYFRQVSSTGAPYDPIIRVTEETSTSRHPSIAWTGSEFGVAWYDRRYGGYDILFQRISPAGDLRGTDVRLTTDGVIKDNPSLSWMGDAYGVSWQNYTGSIYELFFTWFSPDGSSIKSMSRISDGSDPALAWSGSEFGLAWWDGRAGNDDIFFNLINVCP